MPVDEDLVNHGWTEIFEVLGQLRDSSGAIALHDEELKLVGEIVDYQHDATWTRQADLEIIGRDGVKPGEHWAQGMRTYQGLMAHGFPNCYHMGFTQTGYTPNFTCILNNQSLHLAAMLADAKAQGIKALEPTQQAEEDWLALVAAPDAMTEYLANCTPGDYNAEGNAKANNDGFLHGHYPEGGLVIYAKLDEWRATGDYEGLPVRR